MARMTAKSSPHLLVVDDENLSRGLTTLQLSRMGYRVSQAPSGEYALDLIAERPIDLVLLDIDMPDMNGLEVLDHIRRKTSALELPVIMASADDQAASVVDALNRGANDYLVKPINIQVAAARIHAQLSLRDLSRLKDDFVSFASHDLKKPLMLEEDILRELKNTCVRHCADQPSIGQLIDLLTTTNFNMQNVVRGFLDSNIRDDTNTNALLEKLNLNALIHDIIEANSTYSTRKAVRLDAALDAALPMVRTDPFKVRQVIENLIGNALKFSPPNTATTVRSSMANGSVTVEIIDQGPGLKDDDLPKLFQKHAKLSNLPTGNEVSTGVGLALCKEFIQNVKGQIGARNNPQGGATFWIALPDNGDAL